LNFFLTAKPGVATVWPLVYSMSWENEPRTIPARLDDFPIDACTQARFTAVSVMRTMIGMQAFTISKYYFARLERQDIGLGTALYDMEWVTMQMEESDHWMDLQQTESGWVTLSASPNTWANVYSGDGYVRVEGVGLLAPEETINVGVESRALPPEECHA
jgi:hypothetical protein